MNSSTYDITLSIHGHGSNVSVRAKRGDTGRVLRITLMDGRKPYMISEECRAVLTAKKEDGNILYNACEIDGNIIRYEFTPQTTSCAGRAKCEIKLYGADDKLLTSARFDLLVDDTVYNEGDEVESEKEVSELTQLISRTAELTADIEKKLAENAYADAHSAVCFTPQDLLDSQKEQARRNIGVKPDTWLPTIAEIGAAPAGHGLGEELIGISENEINNVGCSGWNKFYNGGYFDSSNSFQGATIRTDGEGAWKNQTAYHRNSNIEQRRAFDGVWQPWEWVNPPMVLGVEYRTTERWNGKAVYTKLVDCGALPNYTAKNVAIGVNATKIVDYRFITIISADGSSIASTAPYLDTSMNNLLRCVIFNNNINLYTNTDMSLWSGMCLVKYTKD